MRGSPKGARRSGGLDFEAEGRCEKVQKERVTTGIFIMLQRAADRCLYVLPEKAGIRKMAKSL